MIDSQGWLRCDTCRKKLGRILDFTGRIEIKCDCGRINVYKKPDLTIVYNIDKEIVPVH